MSRREGQTDHKRSVKFKCRDGYTRVLEYVAKPMEPLERYPEDGSKVDLDQYFEKYDLYGLFHGMFASIAKDHPLHPLEYLIKGLNSLRGIPRFTDPEKYERYFRGCYSRSPVDLETDQWIGFNSPTFASYGDPSPEKDGCEYYCPSEESMNLPTVIPKSPQVRELIGAAIQDTPLLEELDEEERNLVIDVMTEREVSKGEVIFREGDQADNFYVIESGRYGVSRKGNTTHYLRCGRTFNHSALLRIAKQTSAVTATSPGTLWTVDRVTYGRIMTDLGYRKMTLYKGILRTVQLLSNWEENDIYELADVMERTEFSTEQVIINQGDLNSAFFIIESGDVIVSQDGKKIGTLSSHEYFGERALLEISPSPVTVVAAGKLQCLMITTLAFQDTFDYILKTE